MTIVVITGRRMNSSEKLMRLRLPLVPAAP